MAVGLPDRLYAVRPWDLALDAGLGERQEALRTGRDQHRQRGSWRRRLNILYVLEYVSGRVGRILPDVKESLKLVVGGRARPSIVPEATTRRTTRCARLATTHSPKR